MNSPKTTTSRVYQNFSFVVTRVQFFFFDGSSPFFHFFLAPRCCRRGGSARLARRGDFWPLVGAAPVSTPDHHCGGRRSPYVVVVCTYRVRTPIQIERETNNMRCCFEKTTPTPMAIQ